MPVGAARGAEEDVVAAEIRLDGQRERRRVGDPGERGVHDAVLQQDGARGLGTRDTEEDETVVVAGVHGVLLQRVAQHRLGQQGVRGGGKRVCGGLGG